MSPLAAETPRFAYPPTREEPVVEELHGTRVPDPYRWLEDLESPETRAWIEAQNKVTFGFLDKIPARDKLRARLTDLWNYERHGLPTRRAGKYFFTHNNGLRNQSVLYVADTLRGEPRLLLDPNGLSADGAVALTQWQVSDDGRLLAYGLSSAGSDWNEIRVLEVATGRPLPDVVKWVKFSGLSWTSDSAGFFYSRYDEPAEGQVYSGANYYHKLYYHRLGDAQKDDRLVYQRADQKEWSFGGYVTEDGAYLMMHVWRGSESKNQVFYQDLRRPDAPVVELITGFDAEFGFLGNQGETWWFVTDFKAPLKRVIAIDLARPGRDQWREVIPEGRHVIDSVGLVGGKFFVCCLEDARTRARVYQPDGRFERELELPALGTAGGFRGRMDDSETFYAFSNHTTPTTIYRFDIAAGAAEVVRRPKVDFDPSRFVSKQVFYPSKDGTRVPMFIVHRDDLKLDGANPTILYGYGGFDISLTPYFSLKMVCWLEQGGVYAIANLRGGGEYGQEWHLAGAKHNKQNVFDDFIAAAEHLIAEKYTQPAKLAISGGSNGGLLVGACANQRPELFGAALPAVGVMDMLRFHKFTIGRAWTKEFGSPDDPAEFRTLFRYSPLHNLRPGVKYPATLITTGDHDDRVTPAHSYKYAAALQKANAGDAPVLIRVETRAGHGAGKPTAKIIGETSDELAFLMAVFNMEGGR